ncbi:DDE-type integrase/transposase/recombinase, partial [Mesorhizobium sp. PL10]
YRAIDSVGDTVEFWFSEQRDLPAAKRFFRKALERHGRPDRVVIDGSQTNHEAIVSCDTTNRLQDRARRRLKPIRIRRSQYLRMYLTRAVLLRCPGSVLFGVLSRRTAEKASCAARSGLAGRPPRGTRLG